MGEGVEKRREEKRKKERNVNVFYIIRRRSASVVK